MTRLPNRLEKESNYRLKPEEKVSKNRGLKRKAASSSQKFLHDVENSDSLTQRRCNLRSKKALNKEQF